MTPRPTSKRLAAALLAASLLFAGCSPGSGSESVTAEGAALTECQGISDELQRIGDDVGSLAEKVPGDIPGAVAAIDSAISRAGGLAGTVTDPGLRTKVSALTDSLDNLKQAADTAANDPVGGAGDLLDAAGTTRTSYNDLKAYCGM